ncbi:hypothetical protein AHAS_Ahas13G0015700 [Arachis hypogaea]
MYRSSSRIHRLFGNSSSSNNNSGASKYTINFGGKAIETTVTNKAIIVVDQWIEEINVLYMLENQP